MKKLSKVLSVISMTSLAFATSVLADAPELYCGASLTELPANGGLDNPSARQSTVLRYQGGEAATTDAWIGAVGEQGFVVALNSAEPLSVTYIVPSATAQNPSEEFVAGPFEFKPASDEVKGIRFVRNGVQGSVLVNLVCSTLPLPDGSY